MPFRSKRQQRFMFATRPEGVDLKEWAKETDFSKLPEKVRKKKKKKKDKNDALRSEPSWLVSDLDNVFQGDESLESHGLGDLLEMIDRFLEETKRGGDNNDADLPSELEPGFYRHFKGGRYEVLFTARDSETEEPMVVYLNAKGEPWVRPLSMWNEPTDRWPDGQVRPRFVHEDELE